MPARRAPLVALTVAVLGGLVALFPAHALATTTCADVCGTSDPCTIGATITIDPDQVFDCSAYTQIIIGDFGTLKVSDGSFQFLGNSLDVKPGGKIKATATGANSDIGVDIELTGNLDLCGKVLANSDWGGGVVTISTGGYMRIDEAGTNGIEANGTSTDADGGDIELTSTGDVTINCPIHADGDGGSGTTSGGSITIETNGSISTSLDGVITATARKGEGGSIRLQADGAITTGTNLDAFGKLDTGNGGIVDIAADAVTIGGPISVRGGVGANGGQATGGALQIESGCGGVALNANLDARASDTAGLLGGALLIDSVGDVTLAAGVQILTLATQADGLGGDVSIRSQGKVTLQSSVLIDARGDTVGTDGEGASVDIEGCTVELDPSAKIDARGYTGGLVTIQGGDEELALPLGAGTQQLLVIDATASVLAAGNSSDEDGEISLTVRHATQGQCLNQPTVPCTLDSDCTAGCSTDECVDANPDTSGEEGQFDLVPSRDHRSALVSCVATCP